MTGETSAVPAAPPARRPAVALGLLFATWLLAIYLPGVGKGFIRDDFAWIAESTVSSWQECARFLQPASGFYRPMVSLSFTADRALFGLSPLPYGLTNLLLLALCAVAVYLLARAFGLPAAAGILAAGAWSLNHHGINTTVLWICGRTALLLTLFATLAAAAFVRRRRWLAALLTLLAMMSKEEAVLLPLVFLAWAALDASPGASAGGPASRGTRIRRTAAAAWPPFAALAVYAALHLASGAFTPASAPRGYHFSIAPYGVLRNALEYVDRTCTLSAVLLVVALVAARVPLRSLRLRPRLAAAMAFWIAGLFALTIFLPLRSGLYVLAPSVGVAIVAGAWLSDVLDALDARGVRRVAVAAVLVALASLPIYWARNAPNVRRAELTSRVMHGIVPVLRDLPAGHFVVIQDRRTSRATLEDSFGTLTTEAGRLFSGRRDVGVWLEPPPFDATIDGFRAPDPAVVGAVYELDRDTLRRIR